MKKNRMKNFEDFINEDKRFMNRTENTLRTKIDDMVLYFEGNKYKIDLDLLVDSFTGGGHYVKKCNTIIESLKSLKINKE